MISRTLTFFILFLLVFSFTDAEARRKKKKFKGPIIVNQILRLNGSMKINDTPTQEFAGIKEGDILETGENSWAIFRIPGLGIYYLGPQSKLKLSKFAGRDITKFDLEKGNVLSIYKRLGTHEVRANEAIVSPAGNSPSNIFWVTSQDADSVIYLWDGKVQIQASQPEAQAPTPSFVKDVTAVTKTSWQKYLVSKTDGVKEKEELKLAPPEIKTIHDMESLYALP